VIVCLVDIGGIDDHHCLNFLFINLKLIWLFILCRKEKAWDRHKNVVGLNWLMGSQPFHLDNWISNYKML
jgi:hypothetical protein